MRQAESIKEAIIILDEILAKNKKDERSYILGMLDVNDMIVYHHTVGRNIRNEWKLWSDSESALKTELKNLGCGNHADDMSMFILNIFYYHIKFPTESIETIINEYIIKNLIE